MENIIEHYSMHDLSAYGQNHKLNTSIDNLNEMQTEERKGSFAKVLKDDAATVEISELAKTMYTNATDESTKQEVKLNNEYSDAFTSASKDFADFSMKITYGDYNGNDVSAKDLNLDAIDKMEDVYKSYKKQIQSNYEGDEREQYMSKLDEVYNSVFTENIINPIKSAYDDKLTFLQPDSVETMQSIKATATSKDSLQEMISGYVTNQSIKEKQYNILEEGTQAFYNMANDASAWHDSDAIKNTLTDTMNVYSSVKDVKLNSSEYQSAKAAADAIAKKVSDQYAESLKYKEDKLGLTKNGVNIELSQDVQKSINDYITNSSSGMFMVDFSKIPDLDTLVK